MKIFKSFFFLNLTQFLGALNDNIFKLLIVYFLINIKGAHNATTILALAGGVFVIPFLLFSSFAGILADKCRKNKIIIYTKIAELLIMSLSLVALFFKSEISLYFLLFLMALQSTVFGPSKYGIIPELVDQHKLSKANGIITSMTFLAIIIGTFLASFITDITNKNFFLAFFICIIISILGIVTSFGIEKTTAFKSTQKFNNFFLLEIYKTLKLTYKRKNLLNAVFGSAFFLFIGSFVQLNAIPFALQSLNLGETEGGYLFLTTSIGIAIGAFIVGRSFKEDIPLGLSCLCGFLMGILLILTGIFSSFLYIVIICFTSLGLLGGMFLVPLDVFIQIKSPSNRRGQIIAASNFLSFLGVLFSSLALYLICNVWNLSPSFGFIIIGIITLLFTFILSGRMMEEFLTYFYSKILKHFYSFTTNIAVPQERFIFILENKSTLESLILFCLFPNLRLLICSPEISLPTFILTRFFNNIYQIEKIKPQLKNRLDKINKAKQKPNICILIKDRYKLNEIKSLIKETSISSYFVKINKHTTKNIFLILKKKIFMIILYKLNL